jgi:hypothetical protein
VSRGKEGGLKPFPGLEASKFVVITINELKITVYSRMKTFVEAGVHLGSFLPARKSKALQK